MFVYKWLCDAQTHVELSLHKCTCMNVCKQMYQIMGGGGLRCLVVCGCGLFVNKQQIIKSVCSFACCYEAPLQQTGEG